MKKYTIAMAALLLGAGLTACGNAQEETAAVQSVSALCGYGPIGMAQRFSGLVTARSQVEITKEYDQKIKEINVAVGDDVSAGQILFSYDGEMAQMDLDKAKLELEQQKNNLDALKKKKETLEKEKSKASSSQQLSYTLEIQEAEADITEAVYNIAVKEKEIAKQEEGLKNLDVKATVDGVVISINENDETDNYGEMKPFMVISETGNYRVKGIINETNRDVLYEGLPVILRSRISEESWKGTISTIDWENPEKNNNMYGDSDEMGTSSKYPFYVELDSMDGLLMGQHLYIEPDFGQDEVSTAEVELAEWYILDADTDPWVWAENKSGKLEKRKLTLGDYNADMGTYVVLTGIDLEDYIAVPDDTLKEGMACVEYDGVAGGNVEFEPGYDGNDYMDDGSFEEGGYSEDGMYDAGFEEAPVDEDFPMEEAPDAEEDLIEEDSAEDGE